MLDTLRKRFHRIAPAVDFCSLRYASESDEMITVRQDILQPVYRGVDAGAMITVGAGGGMGYTATTDLSEAGLLEAVRRAEAWAHLSTGRLVWGGGKGPSASGLGDPKGRYFGPEQVPWDGVSLQDKVGLLMGLSRALKIDARIVDWEATLWHTAKETIYLTAGGGEVHQKFSFLVPGLQAVANQKAETQHRSFGGLRENSRQGGMEVLDHVGMKAAPARVAHEALELLEASNCPSGRMGVLLAADQMILQVHESVGHPLELDRILGDERNYAGTSFVTPEMFGSYRYGSDLMNVCFDPSRPEQFATYGWDDEGTPAKKEHLIRKGILQRPLGGRTSQGRAGMAGVANCRACSWNRPPIDRMANLNLDAGESTLEQMIAAVKRGVYMRTNTSWSIDDSRNKFQFGCEWGRLIEDGRLTKVVKNPNYRGVSATFWRNLKMVGDAATVEVMGTPFCGKGEPNQSIRVGHACPACLFADVEVFGGAE